MCLSFCGQTRHCGFLVLHLWQLVLGATLRPPSAISSIVYSNMKGCRAAFLRPLGWEVPLLTVSVTGVDLVGERVGAGAAEGLAAGTAGSEVTTVEALTGTVEGGGGGEGLGSGSFAMG